MADETFFVHPAAIVDEGAVIGTGTKIWHFSHVMSTARLGRHCVIGQNVFIGNKVIVGDRVKIQNNVSLYEGVECEEDVFLGPSCVFTNISNPRSFIERKSEFRKTLVRKGASIGANATIICGHTIGAYALVGAGAVITRDVPDFALVMGNPARQKGWVSAHGHRLRFNDLGIAYCPESSWTYQILKDNRVILLDSIAG